MIIIDPENAPKAFITTSWDDGHPLDLKLAELLVKFNIPATLYVPVVYTSDDYPGKQVMNRSEIYSLAGQFDIGGHSFHHLRLTEIPNAQAKWEIEQCKNELENITGNPIRSFAFPYNSYNKRIIKLVQDSGFCSARTTDFYSRKLNNPYQITPTLCASNQVPLRRKFWYLCKSPDIQFQYFLIREGIFLKSWHDAAIDTINFVSDNGGTWHLCGHSWEIEQHQDWKKLEEIFKYIKGMINVRLLNNSELVVCKGSNYGINNTDT